MPFTFAHPVIILPLVKGKIKLFSSSALIAGSMVPDFEYFIRFCVKSLYSHTLFGLFLFDLPLCLVLLFVYHIFVRDCLIDHFPIWRNRFTKYKQFNWNNYFKQHWIIVIISILIGAFSHLLWDGFTHATGYFVQMVSLLSTEMHFLNFKILVYKLLQHVSSFIGIIIIILFINQLPQEKSSYPKKFSYWITVLSISILILLIRVLTTDYSFGDIIVSAITSLFIGIIITSCIAHKKLLQNMSG